MFGGSAAGSGVVDVAGRAARWEELRRSRALPRLAAEVLGTVNDFIASLLYCYEAVLISQLEATTAVMERGEHFGK